MSLRRHQVASLEPSSEEELHLLDLLHTRLTDSLQSLLPSPDSKTPSLSLTLSLAFLHKLLDALLACESDFKSLLLLILSRNPSLISRPPLDRAISDFLDRAVKSLDLCNAVSLSLHSLRHWSRHADIAASALHRPGPPFTPPQINRARRALSKLMCRICSAKKHLQAVAAGLSTPRSGESGSSSVLALAVHTISTLLHFSMWMMVASFPCGSGEVQPPPPIPTATRHMPWALALSRLHEKIGEDMRRERKVGGLLVSAGMLEETLALERISRELLKLASNGEELEAAAAELAISSGKLDEGLGPFERKVREVFHRLVRCREEVIRCLGDSTSSSLSSVDHV
ncbi:Protein BPS1, chloroplastic [Dendrobium catenatum]|uniref:Protein BPS1, chloroplastic n=1 Tax=Dendrobium catenatum TaxID=906689 RepID=A0A2I0W8N6_9ASPA|nr:Protein BPS1, chloroplastic [Dendrobium catenatum]